VITATRVGTNKDQPGSRLKPGEAAPGPADAAIADIAHQAVRPGITIVMTDTTAIAPTTDADMTRWTSPSAGHLALLPGQHATPI